MWTGVSHLPRQDARARAGALKRLEDLTSDLLKPWLVCGDFNTSASWLDPGTPVAVTEPVMTYPADAPAEPIDYCIASPGFRLNAEAIPAAGSDHLPLLTTAHHNP